jgi:hypothetical protein
VSLSVEFILDGNRRRVTKSAHVLLIESRTANGKSVGEMGGKREVKNGSVEVYSLLNTAVVLCFLRVVGMDLQSYRGPFSGEACMLGMF